MSLQAVSWQYCTYWNLSVDKRFSAFSSMKYGASFPHLSGGENHVMFSAYISHLTVAPKTTWRAWSHHTWPFAMSAQSVLNSWTAEQDVTVYDKLYAAGAQATSSSSSSRSAISKCLSVPLLSTIRVLRNYEQTCGNQKDWTSRDTVPELHSRSDYFISIIGFRNWLALQ